MHFKYLSGASKGSSRIIVVRALDSLTDLTSLGRLAAGGSGGPQVGATVLPRLV